MQFSKLSGQEGERACVHVCVHVCARMCVRVCMCACTCVGVVIICGDPKLI